MFLLFQITQLKIENNPFAKGFRSPFSRCRTRNQPRYIIAFHDVTLILAEPLISSGN